MFLMKNGIPAEVYPACRRSHSAAPRLLVLILYLRMYRILKPFHITLLAHISNRKFVHLPNLDDVRDLRTRPEW